MRICAAISNQGLTDSCFLFFFLIFLKKLTKNQDGDCPASLFLAPTAVYLSTDYWAKKMVPVMVAWPERCQSAVPSQPFSELFLISRAQSDSQRQMVFKQNGCGRKSGSWLNQPWQRLGTAKAGLRHPDSLPLDGRSKQEPVVPQLSAILFHRDSLRAAKNNCFHRSKVTCSKKKPDSNLTRSFVWSSQSCATQTWISY